MFCGPVTKFPPFPRIYNTCKIHREPDWPLFFNLTTGNITNTNFTFCDFTFQHRLGSSLTEQRENNNFNDFVWRPVSLLYSCVWGCLTGREEVVDGSGGIERRQLQALSQAVQSMALDSGRFVHPSSKEQVLDKGAVHQETNKVRISTLLRSSLWLLQQNHHHIHREQPVHHL